MHKQYVTDTIKMAIRLNQEGYDIIALIQKALLMQSTEGTREYEEMMEEVDYCKDIATETRG